MSDTASENRTALRITRPIVVVVIVLVLLLVILITGQIVSAAALFTDLSM